MIKMHVAPSDYQTFGLGPQPCTTMHGTSSQADSS